MMEVSSQLHAPVTLILRKKNSVRNEWKPVWAKVLIWMCWKKEKSYYYYYYDDDYAAAAPLALSHKTQNTNYI
jgi:hypothetical protein